MSVRKLKPITPGQRFRIVNNFDEITTNKPEKSLTFGIKKSGGRNNTGKMTMRYTGGGHKKKYRIIDFKRNKFNVDATVKTVEYDPNRTAFIALLEYADGEKRYIVAPAGIKVGQKVVSGENVAPEIGNAMKLKNIPLGSVISCIAMIGSVSNSDHQLTVSGKAGRSRWLGRRPRTRAVVMNPVDHPMGGGEGRSSGGHPRSRNGKPAKGYKTRKKNKVSNRYIVSKRK